MIISRSPSNRVVTSFALATAVLIVAACSGSSAPTSSPGGASNLGGNTSSSVSITGGSANSSGTGQGGSGAANTASLTSAGPTGGAATTGGGASQGGALPSGGSAATGGVIDATGGVKATGGGTNSAGSSNISGGAKSSGGTNSVTGGTRSVNSTTTGGVTHVGGSSSSGGGQTSNGTNNTGGTTNAGGTSTANGAAPASATELCTRWTSDRADLSESGWTGNVSSCTAGDMSATARANALRQVNLFRWIAGLPPVTTSDQYNQDDQACALMMQANNNLSHTPDSSWKCYTSAGATAAQNSCIAGEGAVTSPLGYMIDPGNPTTLGHRRWVLSNYLGPIGIGSTGNYSCMYTGTTGKLTNAWTAWPPPGYFPLQAASDSWGQSINTTGFSVQSDSINLANATVTITLNNTPLSVTVTQLLADYGSSYAISIVPSGWTVAAGNTYHVSITGVSTAITYDIQVVSCS